MASKPMILPAKYEDIISASHRLSSGTPAVYQLNPTGTTTGPFLKLQFGRKTRGRANKTILLVGETGTEKSTMINALVNYVIGVKWEDEIWFEIVKEGQRSQAHSQTSDIVIYEIFGFDGIDMDFSLTIVDTPGYGDTGGKTQDAKISQKLLNLFLSEDEFHEVNAVGLVLKATENQLSDRLKYIFDSVVSLFGKDIEKNIVAMVTHSDGLPPKNALGALLEAKIKCAKNEKNMPVNFLFNNAQRDQRDQRNKNRERALENAWRLTTKGMQQFFKFLEEIQPLELKLTIEALNFQIPLTAAIHNLQQRIKSADETQKAIRQNKSELERNRDNLERDEYFILDVLEEYTELNQCRGSLHLNGVTRCKQCKQNCHYPGCIIAWKASLCEVMAGGWCTVCSGQCLESQHAKDDQKYVSKTRKVKKTLQEILDSYFDRSKVVDSSGLTEAKRRKKDLEKKGFDLDSVLADLEKKVETLEAEKTMWLDKAYQTVLKLDEMDQNMKTPPAEVYLGVLIEKFKERNEFEKVQKLKKMMSEMDKESKEVLKNVFDHLQKTCF